jgi:cardiolipin synthase
MFKRLVSLVIPFFLLLDAYCLGLPAHDVQVLSDREYFQTVWRCFKEAQSSIKVMMFEASYYDKYPSSPTNVLVQELVAAHKRGVAVKVILERRNEREKADVSNEKTGTILSREGVDVVYDPATITTHAKLLIIDGKISVVGSTNWTYSALEKNHEVSVLIHSAEVAQRLQDYFQTIWKTCAQHR